MKEANPMDQMDAIALLYLMKTDYKPASLLDCANQFQQTKAELKDVLQKAQGAAFKEALESGRLF